MPGNPFADNYARSAPPPSEFVSGVAIAVVLIGLMLTLPMFVFSGEVMISLGAYAGAGSLLVSGGLLAILAAVTGHIGAKTRLSTYSIIIAPFGPFGAKALTAMLAAVSIGWFGVTTGFFGEAVDVTVREIAGVDLPTWPYIAAGGALMAGTVLFGFKGITLLNRIAVPLLALVLIVAGASVLRDGLPDFAQKPPLAGGSIKSFGLGVSAMLGMAAALAGGMPDITRFARATKDVVFACLVSFASLTPFLTILAGAPALATGSADFTANLIVIGLGAPALVTLVLATWTTNIINLYASSLSLARLIPGAPDWALTLAAAAAGVLFALAGATTQFIPLLFLLSAAVPPIAGVYVAHYYLFRGSQEREQARAQISACVGWALGLAVALATTHAPFSLTTVPAIDGLLASALFYGALNARSPKRVAT